MKKTEIGTVTISYDEQGNFLKSEFVPVLKMEVDKTLHDRFKDSVQHMTQEEEVQKLATITMAGWFKEVSDIELADRFTEGELVSELEHCTKHDNNIIKECKIRFFFQKIEKPVDAQLN